MRSINLVTLLVLGWLARKSTTSASCQTNVGKGQLGVENDGRVIVLRDVSLKRLAVDEQHIHRPRPRNSRAESPGPMASDRERPTNIVSRLRRPSFWRIRGLSRLARPALPLRRRGYLSADGGAWPPMSARSSRDRTSASPRVTASHRDEQSGVPARRRFPRGVCGETTRC
jgi:hypothetical protein